MAGLKGSVTISGDGGNDISLQIVGSKAPANVSELPSYVADCVKRALASALPDIGKGSEEVVALKLEVQHLKDALEEARAPKKSSKG